MKIQKRSKQACSILFKKFMFFDDKATDYFIKSWELKRENKEIALLNHKKYKRMALKYLNYANEILQL